MNELPDRWNSGEAYEHYMGRWSRLLAGEFMRWIAPSAGWHWLEVGCGTGALTQIIFQMTNPATVTACDPSPGFIGYAQRGLNHPAIRFQVASAGELPRQEFGFDAVVSGLALNFIPDPDDAVATMVERLRPGGMLAGYVWDYSEGMQFIKRFWEVAAELDPAAAEMDEGTRFQLCHAPALAKLLERAGLERVQTHALEIDTHFPDFEDYWAPFLGGTGSAPTYVATLNPAAREALRQRLHRRLSPSGDRPIRLRGRAWAVRGFR